MSEKPTRPPFRYYGGKWRMAQHILNLMPSHTIYTEVFGGSGSVLLQKPRSRVEVYNDLYGSVVNAFRVLRDNGPALQAALHLTPYSREEYEAASEPAECPVEAARRFIVRSTMGIGLDKRPSCFRVSADLKNSTAPSFALLPDALPAIISRLRGVVIENRDAQEVMQQFDTPETVHYVDPPYLSATRKDSSHGYVHELKSSSEHSEMLECLKNLKGKVMLSGYPSPVYDAALADWQRHEFAARDQTSKARTEVLWCNFLTDRLF